MGGLDAKYEPYSSAGGSVREKAFADMGPRPDNSWPEERGTGADSALLGGSHGYGGGGGYDVPQSPPRSAAPQGYGYGGGGFR